MKSPCLKCGLRDDDKNNPTCRECDDRIQYAMAIEEKPRQTKPAPQGGDEMEKTIQTMPKTKKCRVCGLELPVSEFYTHHSTRDGLQIKCKKCYAAADRERYLKKKNKKPVKKQADKPERVVIKATPENKPDEFVSILAKAPIEEAIIQKMAESAKRNLRTLENEIIWAMKKYLDF